MKSENNMTPLPRLYSFAVAGLSALLLALAMPGMIGWWPLLFIALVPLLVTIPYLPTMRSGCMGMFCGLLYNISLLYWIVIVLGRYGGLPPWLSVPAMTLLAMYMAGYIALFCLLMNLVWIHSAKSPIYTFLLPLAPAILWVGLDYLRGFLFTGFPWMDLGYGLYQQPFLIQAADLGGHHLVTFCIVLVNSLLALVISPLLNKKGGQEVRLLRKASVWGAVVVLLVLVSIGGYSYQCFQDVSKEMAAVSSETVAVIQGNISQSEKWSPARKEETIHIYTELSRQAMEKRAAGEKRVGLLVWPETALPFYPPQDPLIRKVLDFARDQEVLLLTGSPYYELKKEKIEGEKEVDFFNSALLIDNGGRAVGRYDKQHLVPFGEYVPLGSVFFFLKKLVVGVGDFTRGTSYTPLEAGSIKAGVLICFEAIFPDIARREAGQGSNLLVNLTNDAWYGRSSAPHQSWSMSVLRAVENRRSLVRAANTGISGIVDPSGTIRAQSELFVPAALSETIPLLTNQTIFQRGGYWFGACCLCLSVLLLFIPLKRLWLDVTGK